MATNEMKFWFEHGGGCLWAANTATVDKYGYGVDYELLPIADDLRLKLADMDEEYRSYLNWEYPPDPSPWTPEQKARFIKKAELVFAELRQELGNDYLLRDNSKKCVL